MEVQQGVVRPNAVSAASSQGFVLLAVTLLLLLMSTVALALAASSRLNAQSSSADGARQHALWQLAQAQHMALRQPQRVDAIEPLTLLVEESITTEVRLLQTGACRRQVAASAVDVLQCQQQEWQSTIRFGRQQRGSVTLITGIEQPLLASAFTDNFTDNMGE
ncbi:MAG: hypothetical protein R3Y10_03170 [Ferrimonas sp.]